MNIKDKVFVSGHNGLVGSALVRKLNYAGYKDILTVDRSTLDLEDQKGVFGFFEKHLPDVVFVAAAKVGGIHANNTYPAEFIYSNLMVSTNLIHASYTFGVKKLLFLGSSCIYPRDCSQPIKEEYLLTGQIEKTNEPYAIAKIASITMCDSYNRQYSTNFISVMPTNLYGPNDNYDLNNSHVLPALIRRMHEAKINNQGYVTAWGTGSPYREFLHVDDLADACVFLMENYNASDIGKIINIGSGSDITIKELTEMVADVVGFTGEIVWDKSKPDGTSRKLMDSSKIRSFGWSPKIDIRNGIHDTYKSFLNGCS